MHIVRLVKIHLKIHWYLLKLSSGNKNMNLSQADNSVKNWWNFPISNPKSDLHNINAHSKFGENPLISTQVNIHKWKYDLPQADNSIKNWLNFPISIPKPNPHNINAKSKFGENPLTFTQAIVRKRKYGWTYNKQTDGQTQTWNHNILSLSCGGV